MKLKDLNVGDVCITTYQDDDDDDLLEAISIVVQKYPSGDVQLSDIVALNFDVPDKAWEADNYTTKIKEVLFTQENPGTLEELALERIQKDFPEYNL